MNLLKIDSHWQKKNFEKSNDIDDRRENAYKFIIFLANFMSITSLLIICLIIPSMYNYVNNIRTFSRQDFQYCEVILYFFIFL